MNLGKAIAAVGLTLGLAACSGGGGSAAPAVTLTSIAITPASASIAKGATANLTATGTFSNGTTSDITTQVAWISADAAIASVGASTGIVTGVTVNTTAVTAELNGVTSPAASITVTAATLTGIAITPTTASIDKGTTTTFSATGTYSDSTTGNISGSVSWNSSDTAVATINASGIATGITVGGSTISATLSGKTSNTATLTITAPTLTAIAITPASATLVKGATAHLTATGTYSNGTTADITTSVTWASAASGTASVGANTGIVTGVAVGNTTVTAALSGVTSPTASITVNAATLTSIAITPTAAYIAKGTTTTFTATGTYSDGTTGNVSGSVTWSSIDTTIVTVNATGLATAVAQGSTTVMAILGTVASGTTLTVTAPVMQSITVTPAGITILVGQTQQFTAIGNFSDGTTQDISAIATWTSSNTVAAPISATGLATGVSIGSTYIIASLNGISNFTPISLATVLTGISDTGITAGQCYQAGSDVLVDCASVGALALNNAQDGMVGRDANATTNVNADGKLGFTFTSVPAAGSDPGGCVKDNISGLMWESKTTDGGLRDMNGMFTNYSAAYNPSNQFGMVADASGFVGFVNARNLCGYNDWRLPTAEELQSIVDYGRAAPSIDVTWFPNTQGGGPWGGCYWSASPDATNYIAWMVDFTNGRSKTYVRDNFCFVRLVRAGQQLIIPRYTVSADGYEVLDNQTKLIWRRCIEGMIWDGTACSGNGNFFTHEAALQHAATQANSTGMTWRLPNVKELSSIVDNILSPSIDSTAFPNTPSERYWTASPYALAPDITKASWFVDFGVRNVGFYEDFRTSVYHVRLVRTSP